MCQSQRVAAASGIAHPAAKAAHQVLAARGRWSDVSRIAQVVKMQRMAPRPTVCLVRSAEGRGCSGEQGVEGDFSREDCVECKAGEEAGEHRPEDGVVVVGVDGVGAVAGGDDDGDDGCDQSVPWTEDAGEPAEEDEGDEEAFGHSGDAADEQGGAEDFEQGVADLRMLSGGAVV